MHCPFCNTPDTKVIDSRLGSEGTQVRRRRECLICAERFTTYETVEFNLPRVKKRDGRCYEFDLQKMRSGMIKALEKRPVNMDDVDIAVHHIVQKLRARGEREVDSLLIGECVMSELKKLDTVAYVRFASVYRSFEDVDAFNREIQQLKQDNSNNDH